MQENHSSYLWLRIVGGVALVACLYLVSVTLLRHHGSLFIFLRQAACGFVGLCFLFCSFRRKWLGLASGIVGLLCLVAADLVRWKSGAQSLSDALLPWILPTAFLVFFFWRATRRKDSDAA